MMILLVYSGRMNYKALYFVTIMISDLSINGDLVVGHRTRGDWKDGDADTAAFRG